MFGTTVEFTPVNDVQVYFVGARPSREECVVIGWTYYEAKTSAQDDMLNDLSPVLVRRSLRAFANYAKKNAQPQVGAFAELLRDDIQVVGASAKTA